MYLVQRFISTIPSFGHPTSNLISPSPGFHPRSGTGFLLRLALSELRWLVFLVRSFLKEVFSSPPFVANFGNSASIWSVFPCILSALLG